MWADACYRALLLILPADLRRDFGDEMVRMFRDERRLLAARPLLLCKLWIAALGDVLREAAGARFGGLLQRHSLGTFMRSSWFDFRHGIRLLRHYPASSSIAILTLALGIGANTAIFSVVQSVLLRELPYRSPDRLVMLSEKRPRERSLGNPVAPADFLDWRRRQDVFESIAAKTESPVTIIGLGDAFETTVGLASWNFFDVLGVRAALGRTFIPQDEVFGTHRHVVLTNGFWHRRFGGDSAALGRTIQLNGNPWQIVGVLPADFRSVDPFEVWLPLVLERPDTPPASRSWHSLDVYAQLKPGVTLARARERLDVLGAAIEQENPATNTGHGIHAVPAHEKYVQAIRPSLIAMTVGVGLVLLIACVNVANLLLARAATRRREMAIRGALGASRLRIVGQSLVESLTLSSIGAIAGLGVAAIALRALPAILPEQISVVSLTDLRLDASLTAFALGLAIFTGLLFGLLPALHISKPTAADALAQGGRSAAGVRRRSRIALVVGEVALATLTLVGSGLVLRSIAEMLAEPIGFMPNGRIAAGVLVGGPRYADSDRRRIALEQIEQSLAAIPGVTSVGAIDMLPMGGGNSRMGMVIEGREPVEGEQPIRMHPRVVTPGYFRAVGTPIVKGRAFTPEDDGRAEPVVIISEMAARQFWPDRDPVGKRVQYAGNETWRTVVGVARDVRHWGRRTEVSPMIYRPQAQVGTGFLDFVISTPGDPALLGSAIRARVAAIDANLPVTRVRTLDDVVARSFRADRSLMVLMSTFGGLALVLAVIGIYGVMAQLAQARVPEIGVRMTLGARPADILKRFLSEGLWQALAGVAIGLGAGVYVMRFAENLLYDVQPWDPVALAGVGVILVTAALAACFIPARRAMKVDPVQALRSQ